MKKYIKRRVWWTCYFMYVWSCCIGVS